MTTATPGRRYGGSRPALSDTWRPRASSPRTISPWGRAGRWQDVRELPGSWPRCATGAATAGASRASRHVRQRFTQRWRPALGYDHKYVYSHLGYNLKLTDLQAAIGLAQLSKLPGFRERRRANFRRLKEGLRSLEGFFILPRETPRSNPSWFGFPLAVHPEAPISRNQVIQRLEARMISTRLLFGGNLVRQPAYRESRFRIAGDLSRSDFVAENVFWLGLHPGITDTMADYVIMTLHDIARELS